MPIEKDEVNQRLLDKELTLEGEMATLGLLRYRARQQTVNDRSQPWATDAAREYTAQLLETIAERIETRLNLMAEKPGPTIQAREHIAFLPTQVVALLAVRSALNSVMRMRTITRSSVMLGGEVEKETRYHNFRAAFPGLFETIKRRIQNSTSPGYKHKVLVSAMKSTGWEYQSWDDDLKLRVGAVLLDILINLGVVERRHPLIQNRQRKGAILSSTKELNKWLAAYDDYYELLSPLYLPCLVPPREWQSPTSGGYHGDVFDNLTLVKGTSNRYVDSLQGVKMPAVYRGLSLLQEVAWTVHQPILDLVQEHWTLNREVGTLPGAEDKPLPPKPRDMDTNKVAQVAWKRKAAAIWDGNIRSRSKRIAAMQIIATARRYGDAAFYYPHQLDFRSRVYTVPHPLTVQGSDLCRGILQFHNAKAIQTQEGADWLAIHGANSFGFDKVSYGERIQWAKDNTQDVLRCADNPFENKWWIDADDPWQFLRWCFEWRGFVAEGLTYRSRLPISVDQSCSGLQHYAALLLDDVSGLSTNLVPSDTPHDIYTDVAAATIKKVEKMSDPFAAMWLTFGIERSTLKRIVMTTPYGSRKYSHRAFIVDDINKRGNHPFKDQVPEAAQWLANIIWDTIGEVVVAARQGMNWFRDVARLIVKGGQPVKWTTPVGFPVEQSYQSMASRQVRLSLGDGSSVKSTLRIPKGSGTPDVIRQVNGVAPNIIHSLDSTVLFNAVILARSVHGLVDVGVVHDSFSTHACDVVKLQSAIRQAFVDVYSKPVMQDLAKQFETQTDSQLPPLPTSGSLEIQGVLNSLYFAG